MSNNFPGLGALSVTVVVTVLVLVVLVVDVVEVVLVVPLPPRSLARTSIITSAHQQSKPKSPTSYGKSGKIQKQSGFGTWEGLGGNISL